MKYFIGALLGVNIALIWFLGIHLTKTEARVRHNSDQQIMTKAELLICSEKVKGVVEEVMKDHLTAHGH